ncbi:hypothetical protein NDU88_003583 [Pleurodeles waltl]|uniref:Uncharacterized protein n=1 Tax=Pleurodeles waltl TaxID=8319 RepID=A0AAV7MTV0_PLEWA|nr:hypothetical protein NDU88_003583 [Pleurodeles waltl]
MQHQNHLHDPRDIRHGGTKTSADCNHRLALRESKQAKRKAQVVAEMELQAGSPPPPVMRGEQLDVDVPDLDHEQMHAILGCSLPATPQTAEDVL